MSQAGSSGALPPAAAPADEVEQSLYEVRKRIHPRAVSGWFAGWRIALVLATQILFYGLAWLQWNGRQAVLFDIARRRFYLFDLVLWPQDIVFLTGILVLSALSLFLVTAVGGRLFCGYACPQTVYTEVFMWIERRFEGDRQARMRLDAAPWSVAKLARRGGKHAVWLALSLWTGLTFVGYFVPIREVLAHLLAFTISGWQLFWVFFYGFATYGNAGFMREQVCKYMCPYARFQSSMFDKDTLIITYDTARGDPRGSRARKAEPRSLGLGDCIDCGICVEVCPTGIDIRKGLQYECIGCAACIDGCNQIMDRMGYAPGLIRYSTQNAVREGWSREQILRRVMRPRTLIYASILFVLAAVLVTALAMRVPLRVDVLRDRIALGRVLDGGVVENVYRLQIMNTAERPHVFRVGVEGLPGVEITSAREVSVGPASLHTLVTTVHVPPGADVGSRPIRFTIQAIDRPSVKVTERSIFRVPQ